MLTLLVIVFIAVNAIGVVKAGRYGLIPVLLGLKANFWYVPIFFIGRRYFTSYRQIGAFWRRLVWPLIPVLGVGVWQVLFGQFGAAMAPTTTVDAASWAAAGSGSMRNNTDGTLIATVASTFYGGRFAVFAAIWLLLMTVLCLTDQKKEILSSHSISVCWSGMCFGVDLHLGQSYRCRLSVVCMAALVASAEGRHSARFLARIAIVAALVLVLTQVYRASRRSDVSGQQVPRIYLFFAGLLDTRWPGCSGFALFRHRPRPFAGLNSRCRGRTLRKWSWPVDSRSSLHRCRCADHFRCPKSKRSTGGQPVGPADRRIWDTRPCLYLAIAFWVLRRLVVEALRVRRQSWRDGLVAALAPALLFLYLGIAHKHAGFAVDPMFQCYLFFVTGSALGVATRASAEAGRKTVNSVTSKPGVSLRNTVAINIAMTAMNVGASVICARMLGPLGRGAFSVIQLWPITAAGLGTLGLPRAMAYYMGKRYYPESNIVTTGAIILLISAGLSAAILYALMPWLTANQPQSVAMYGRWCIALLPLLYLGCVPYYVLQGLNRLPTWKIVRLQFPLLWVAMHLAGYLLGRRDLAFYVWGYVAVAEIHNLTWLLVFVAHFKVCGKVRAIVARRLFQYGLPLTLSSMPHFLTCVWTRS